VTHALAASFKYYGQYTPEQIAEVLLLTVQSTYCQVKDKERAIERAIGRSHHPSPNANVSGKCPWSR
jgi:hypothetical protein